MYTVHGQDEKRTQTVAMEDDALEMAAEVAMCCGQGWVTRDDGTETARFERRGRFTRNGIYMKTDIAVRIDF